MKSSISLLMLFALSTLAAATSVAQEDHYTTKTVSVVAHRGAMMLRPDNTLEAFQKAVEQGAHIVELDVRLSRDGIPFILHDATVDRTTNGTGEASKFTMAELQELDTGSWFDAAYAGTRIPSLAEALEWANSTTTLLLDLKESGESFNDAVASVVKAHGHKEDVVIGVRSPEQARWFREHLPACRQLGFMPSPGDIESFAEAGIDVLRLWLSWLKNSAELVDEVRQTGAKLMINGSTGELDEVETILSFEPDWILIDDLAQLFKSTAALNQVM